MTIPPHCSCSTAVSVMPAGLKVELLSSFRGNGKSEALSPLSTPAGQPLSKEFFLLGVGLVKPAILPGPPY